ncbi:hypothetical protein BH09VER1_BH09VER1_07600 [soil metagenome]
MMKALHWSKLGIWVAGLAFCVWLTAAKAAYPTEGGAKGRIITVTTLAESGTGSLREALLAKGCRTIRFGVSGEIWISDALDIQEPYVTVDGETAPSPGISVMGDGIHIHSHDVILRHIRVRVGSLHTGTEPQNRDGIAINGGENCGNILVENCSVAWALDENMQVWGTSNHDVVIRNCLIAEGLRKSLHPKGGHSAGLIVGPTTKDYLLQGNLFASNSYRNPVITADTAGFVINNLVYNPGAFGFHVYGRDGVLSNSKLIAGVIGNCTISGPNTKPELEIFQTKGLNSGSKIYLADNRSEGTQNFDEKEMPPGWAATEASPFVSTCPLPLPKDLKILPADQVEQAVLANCGARTKDRDELDRRIINEVANRTGMLADAPGDTRLTWAERRAWPGEMANYAGLLKKYVTPMGVCYEALEGDAEDQAALDHVVNYFSALEVDDLASSLNAYNAWMLHEVLRERLSKNSSDPAKQIMERRTIRVAGRDTSLHDLAEDIIKRFPDERVIFALYGASLSGPALHPTPFSEELLRTELDQAVGAFINSPKALWTSHGAFAISRIFDWHKGNFPRGPLPFIRKYHGVWLPDPPELLYLDYDWSLDQAPSSAKSQLEKVEL